MNSIIKINELEKSYGTNKVLNGITFNVMKGEIFALLGANGAGKTTILECIEGIRTIDNGTIDIDGTIGVQLQSSSLPANIKVHEALTLFSKYKRNNQNIDFNARIGLDEIGNKKYEELSTGQKRKLHLALAIIGEPDIIILDEPTAGLDVESRVVLHNEIRRLKHQGKTIIIASHDMAEVEDLSDRISILKNGNLVYIGPISELLENTNAVYKIGIKFSKKPYLPCLISSKYSGEVHGYSTYESANIEDALLELLNLNKKQKINILDIKIEQTNLENKFIKIIGRDNQ